MPTNGWPLDPVDKEIGQFVHLDIAKFVPGTVKIMLAAGMTEEELPDFLASVKYDFADAKLRIYWLGTFLNEVELFILSALLRFALLFPVSSHQPLFSFCS